MFKGIGSLVMRPYVYVAAAIVVLIAASVWYVISFPAPQSGTTQAAQEINAALAQTQTAATTSIPATTNPIKEATPAVNPVDATNPFGGASTAGADTATNNDYQNPFQ